MFIILGWSGGDRQIPGLHWPARLVYLLSSGPARDPDSKTTVDRAREVTAGLLFGPLLTCTGMHTRAPAHTEKVV